MGCSWQRNRMHVPSQLRHDTCPSQLRAVEGASAETTSKIKAELATQVK